MIIRKPAVAGMFYPEAATELSRMLNQLLNIDSDTGLSPKALVVPHAGYIYSGSIAGSAYHTLSPRQNTINKVMLLGPSHHVGFRGIAYCEATHFLTPLGVIEQDQKAIESIRHLSQVVHSEAAHLREHSLEVQLPFLQICLSNFTLVPLVVGEASSQEVSEVIEELWGGDETLIIISTDLSHYLDYEEANAIDQSTSNAIVDLQYEQLTAEQACGYHPLAGLLKCASQHQLSVTVLDQQNSGDTAGDKSRVVGYGAYALQ